VTLYNIKFNKWHFIILLILRKYNKWHVILLILLQCNKWHFKCNKWHFIISLTGISDTLFDSICKKWYFKCFRVSSICNKCISYVTVMVRTYYISWHHHLINNLLMISPWFDFLYVNSTAVVKTWYVSWFKPSSFSRSSLHNSHVSRLPPKEKNLMYFGKMSSGMFPRDSGREEG